MRAAAIRAAAAAVLALAGCSGAGVAAFMPGQEIEVAGDVFSVTIDGTRAVAMNFATGAHNQERLFANAREAITRASGCAIAHFEQEPGVNTYRARLDCAGQ
ncbi:MAG: hypothetical protein IT542_08200 [Rubellimicrobium sp.]|nr:hypothetical protein [Rubellimicrobium sp.]